MANYYKKDKRKPFIVKILWWLFVAIAVINSVCLSLSYLAPTLNPYTYWYVAFLGLITPILMLVNIFSLAIFGVKLSKLAFIPLVSFLLGIGYIGNFLQLNFSSQYNIQEKKSHKEFTVMTYNVHNFGQYGGSGKSTLTDIIQYAYNQDPDIICFQEFMLRNDRDKELIDTKLKDWKYQTISYVVGEGTNGWGLAVLSKFQLISASAIRFSDRSNSAMMVDVVIGQDTVRLFNNHLQSTHFNQLNRQELEQGNPQVAARKVSSTLRNNYKIRAFQADSIAAFIEQSPYRAVAVGDFNDTPMSYVYHTIRGEMSDTFNEQGSGYEYTYRPFRQLFRIDYILHSKAIETITHASPDLPWSDHKPVIAKLKIE